MGKTTLYPRRAASAPGVELFGTEGEPMRYLPTISKPADLRGLTSVQLEALAGEVREFLIDSVSKTGGHLIPNPGVVELTIALHRVFDSPVDEIVFDTGHQAYVHKMLTGRQDFRRLRRQDGISGYPCRAESEHDVLENSHASGGLSWSEGMAQARLLDGRPGSVVTVVGDGALTGGMAWEALNNIADHPRMPLVIVVNDNGRSYLPTIGGMAHHLDALRTSNRYESALRWGKNRLKRGGKPSQALYGALHGVKRGLKDMLVPSGVFDNLGIKYTGPVDGHDITALEFALTRAKQYGGPVIVHVITEKGRGYDPAIKHDGDRFHAVGKIHSETGLPVAPSRFGWTSVFADEIVKIGAEDSSVVGITAAMLAPVGLAPFKERFPQRTFDVGIAEQHAVTSAAGLAHAGKHPVIALYATFLNRAYDQLLMDCALHRLPVTVALDRAGLTGEDGASHNGMWDIAMAASMPEVRLAAPRDEATLRRALRQAVAQTQGPTVVRYPKGDIPKPLEAIETVEAGEVLARGNRARVGLIGVGPYARTAVEIAQRLEAEGVAADVLDPGWILPISQPLVEWASKYSIVLTYEDGLVTGGFGDCLRSKLAASGKHMPLVSHGIPRRFLPHGKIEWLRAHLGLDDESLYESTARAVSEILG